MIRYRSDQIFHYGCRSTYILDHGRCRLRTNGVVPLSPIPAAPYWSSLKTIGLTTLLRQCTHLLLGHVHTQPQFELIVTALSPEVCPGWLRSRGEQLQIWLATSEQDLETSPIMLNLQNPSLGTRLHLDRSPSGVAFGRNNPRDRTSRLALSEELVA